jgi:hypothetical protein
VPPEWFGGDWDRLEALLERLYRRRSLVPELLRSAKQAGRDPFPQWTPAVRSTSAEKGRDCGCERSRTGNGDEIRGCKL